MKKCLLIISSLACFSHIDAGWRDQWVWFKSLFSGFSIKKPTVTRKQMVIGGVGALAVAGAAWWWLKSPKKPTNKSKNPNATLGRSQKTSSSKQQEIVTDNSELLQQPQNLGQSIELTINQPKEINDDDPVSIDFSDNFLYSNHNNIFGIVKTDKGLEVETILNIKKLEKLIKTHNAQYKKVTLKSVNSDFKDINQYDYVFVNHILDDGQKVILIGKYISHDDDTVTVLSGSLFYDIELKNRKYKVSDVFVPVEKEEIQIVESDVNEGTLIKEENRIKLAKIESELKKANEEKLFLELQLAHEKTSSFIKEAKDLITQKKKLNNFEQLLTQYENNKNEADKIKLTEQFNTLDPAFSNNESELWKNLTKRYNAIIKGTVKSE